MTKELSERQKLLLTLMIHEHTRTAQPVGSKSIVDQFALTLSSATIRNDLAAMTELGYLRQPHTSAGRVPTEEGYRYFVSNLVQQTNLPANTRNTISHQFYQSPQGLDQWLRLAASVLANQSQAASLVTAPHTAKVAFKHIELLSTRSTQVLLVLVLVGGEIRQRILSLDETVSQEHLSELATRINGLCQTCSAADLEAKREQLNPLGMTVLGTIVEEMHLSETLVTGDVYLDGLTNVLAEPEFAQSELAHSPIHLLEERTLLNDLISRTVMTEQVGGVQVLIGGEGTWSELRDCSVILTRYGIPDRLTGTIGVLGPMRMPYGHTISTVRFMAGLLSDLVSEHLVE